MGAAAASVPWHPVTLAPEECPEEEGHRRREGADLVLQGGEGEVPSSSLAACWAEGVAVVVAVAAVAVVAAAAVVVVADF